VWYKPDELWHFVNTSGDFLDTNQMNSGTSSTLLVTSMIQTRWTLALRQYFWWLPWYKPDELWHFVNTPGDFLDTNQMNSGTSSTLLVSSLIQTRWTLLALRQHFWWLPNMPQDVCRPGVNCVFIPRCKRTLRLIYLKEDVFTSIQALSYRHIKKEWR
jgi:hypothetical protein